MPPTDVVVIGSKDTDGSAGPAVSWTTDANGRPVQRVVDAAPFLINYVKPVVKTHSVVNVVSTAGGTNILAANALRRYVSVFNNSDVTIFITDDGSVPTLDRGYKILPGGFYSATILQGDMTVGVIRGIHAGTGSKQMLVAEGV